VGLIGIVIGAWLNALLTTRRERWNLRRDLYTRLLENLGEAKAAQGSLWDLEVNDRHSDIESVVNYRKNRIEELSKRDDDAVQSIRRATSIAAIMLSNEALHTLNGLQFEWSKAKNENTYFNYLDTRTAATAKAYQLLVDAAKKDLRMESHLWLRALRSPLPETAAPAPLHPSPAPPRPDPIGSGARRTPRGAIGADPAGRWPVDGGGVSGHSMFTRAGALAPRGGC